MQAMQSVLQIRGDIGYTACPRTLKCRFGPVEIVMDSFRFSPELFEIRTDVLSTLNEAGFDWLSHYSSVDPIHDLYGIEVCGIVEMSDAIAIRELLCGMFPEWRVGCLCYKDYGCEPGFKARVHRDKPRDREQWETA